VVGEAFSECGFQENPEPLSGLPNLPTRVNDSTVYRRGSIDSIRGHLKNNIHTEQKTQHKKLKTHSNSLELVGGSKLTI
jgi:hypothetical protein